MKKLKLVLLRIFGAALAGFATSVFFVPNKIVCGGVSGIATILNHTLHIPAGITFAIINIVLILFSIKVLGKAFTIKTAIGAGLLSAFVQVFSYVPPLTDNVMLAVIFGGVIYGFGLGIVFATDSTSGGTDILGRLIQHKYPTMQIGKMLMLLDGVIITTSLCVFREIDLALFGIIALFISTFAIDWLISRLNVSSIAFVISDRGEEISKRLISTSPRGVTIIDVLGAYTGKPKKMLFCALKDIETTEFKKKILDIDSEAFVVFAESPQIMGNGFYYYR